MFRPSGTYFIATDIRPLGTVLSEGGHGFAFCKRTSVLEEAVAQLKRLTA